MKKLTQAQINQTLDYVENNCRKLELARLKSLLKKGSSDRVVEELDKFQNSDGGFGHGLEPDFQMPDSSPMATTIGFQIMEEIRWVNCYTLFEKGLEYFENSYNEADNRWFAVSEKVNDFPHAPWWQFDCNEKMTRIDNSWGNPSAEILAYLIRHYEFIKKVDIAKILDAAIDNLEAQQSFSAEHEIYCYLKLFDNIDIVGKQRLFPLLERAMHELIEYDQDRWNIYVPRPMDFVSSPKSEFFPIVEEYFDDALDYIIDSFDEEKLWDPNWEWGQYPEAWIKAKEEWKGIIAVKNIKLLKNFDRIE